MTGYPPAESSREGEGADEPAGRPDEAAWAASDLLDTIAALRTHCPWTRALDHAALVEYLVEESYEVVEAIEEGHPDAELCAELGDLLLQVVLHARIAEEGGRFDFASVAAGLNAKMVRRNPHVFNPDGSLRGTYPATIAQIEATWHAVKTEESPVKGPFDGIPASLPALARAQKSLQRLHRAGSARVPEMADAEPGAAALAFGVPQTEEELGEALFALVAAAQKSGLDAERALRTAVGRFQRDVRSGAD